MVTTIDLKFLGFEKAIAAFLIESEDGLILVETGPHSCFDVLTETLIDMGKQVEDIKHVLLTHIHLDHAGGAWMLAEMGATIYVHPVGAPHLIDPSRLLNSAREIYGDKMEILWGQLNPIPEKQVYVVKHEQIIHIGEHFFKAWFTPGHAKHHIAWQFGDMMFTGDVAGIKVDDSIILPPCPPPDINLKKWQSSILTIQSLNPSKLYLTHFGEVQGSIYEHLDLLSDNLFQQSEWVFQQMQAGLSKDDIILKFKEYMVKEYRAQGMDDGAIDLFHTINPSWTNVAGLMRYWEKSGRMDSDNSYLYDL